MYYTGILGSCQGLRGMHHDPIEAARRQDAVEENQGFGAEADDVACLGAALIDGFVDGLGYNGRNRRRKGFDAFHRRHADGHRFIRRK